MRSTFQGEGKYYRNLIPIVSRYDIAPLLQVCQQFSSLFNSLTVATPGVRLDFTKIFKSSVDHRGSPRF